MASRGWVNGKWEMANCLNGSTMCDKCAGQAQRIRGDTHTRTHTLPHTHPCRDTKSCSTRRCRWHSKIPLGLVDNYDWVSAAYTHTAAASGSGINIAKHLNIFDWWQCYKHAIAAHNHTHPHTHPLFMIYVCVCVSVGQGNNRSILSRAPNAIYCLRLSLKQRHAH